MRKAFTVCFPSEQEHDDDGDHLDDPELRWFLTLEDQQTVDVAMAKKQRLQCFAHTLQLVVGDGSGIFFPFKVIKTKSTAAHEHNMQRCVWCWIWGTESHPCCSQHKMELNTEASEGSSLIQSSQAALVDILKPFGAATDWTQGEKVITISAVVPFILSLNHHLEKLKPQVCFLSGLVRSLQASLNKRFLWIFISVKMARTHDGITASFSDPVSLETAALDPASPWLWVELLAVPAPRAPVERVFCHGGIKLRPHRAQMTDRPLATLVFCKCNAA